MAKRKARKPAKSKPSNKSPISKQSRKKLTKELKNARARIRGMMNQLGAAYSGPSIETFYINNVIDMIKQGTHINTIYAMAKNATAKNIRKQTERNNADPIVGEMYGGAGVRQSEMTNAMRIIAKANRNIQAAHERFSDFPDILPNFISLDEILGKVTTTKGLNEVLKVIDKAFVPRKLVPQAVNEDGEAGTKAELEYLKYFVTNENKKRKEAREDIKAIYDKRKMFKTQQEFDVQEIDTSTWDTLEKWRKRSNYLTDARDLDRANNWITNYINSLNDTVLKLTSERGVTSSSDIQKKLNQIFEIIRKIKTTDEVRAVTRYSEEIDIPLNYFWDITDLDTKVDNLFEAWQMFESEYL